MPLTISDEMLRRVGLNGHDALVEFACRLFDAGTLGLWSAAQLAGLDRVGFEAEIRRRNIPLFRPAVRDLADDLAAMDSLEN